MNQPEMFFFQNEKHWHKKTRQKKDKRQIKDQNKKPKQESTRSFSRRENRKTRKTKIQITWCALVGCYRWGMRGSKPPRYRLPLPHRTRRGARARPAPTL
jgi:hypothetical protein